LLNNILHEMKAWRPCAVSWIWNENLSNGTANRHQICSVAWRLTRGLMIMHLMCINVREKAKQRQMWSE